LQIYDQKYFESDFIFKIKNHYALPFFEQNWGMFSPTPPMGNLFFLVKYVSNKNESNYIDIHKNVRRESFSSLFSINQRIIKYFAGCYNDIARKKRNGINIEGNKQLSHGLESILNYSTIVLATQKDFLKTINRGDSIFIKIYLIDEKLNQNIFNQKSFTKSYIELEKIYLTNKK
jgi:hypothetical protein